MSRQDEPYPVTPNYMYVCPEEVRSGAQLFESLSQQPHIATTPMVPYLSVLPDARAAMAVQKDASTGVDQYLMAVLQVGTLGLGLVRAHGRGLFGPGEHCITRLDPHGGRATLIGEVRSKTKLHFGGESQLIPELYRSGQAFEVSRDRNGNGHHFRVRASFIGRYAVLNMLTAAPENRDESARRDILESDTRLWAVAPGSLRRAYGRRSGKPRAKKKP